MPGEHLCSWTDAPTISVVSGQSLRGHLCDYNDFPNWPAHWSFALLAACNTALDSYRNT